MDPLVAPAVAGATLLVLGGTPKLARPHDTRRALRSVGLPVPTLVVRLGGLVEAALGAWAVLEGGRVADALVAASYLAFSAFVVVAIRGGGVLASCGCLGRPDTPPTVSHVLTTAALAGAAGAAAVLGPTGVLTVAPSISTATGLAVLGFSALLTWLVWLALAELPRLRAIVRSAA